MPADMTIIMVLTIGQAQEQQLMLLERMCNIPVGIANACNGSEAVWGERSVLAMVGSIITIMWSTLDPYRSMWATVQCSLWSDLMQSP